MTAFIILNVLQSINIKEIFNGMEEFLEQNRGEKKEAILLGEAVFIRPLQRRVLALLECS